MGAFTSQSVHKSIHASCENQAWLPLSKLVQKEFFIILPYCDQVLGSLVLYTLYKSKCLSTMQRNSNWLGLHYFAFNFNLTHYSHTSQHCGYSLYLFNVSTGVA